MTKLEAVIYDMDGVLIDSEKLWQLAEVDTFTGLGIPFTVEDGQKTMGMRTDAVVRYWFDQRPWDAERFPQRDVVRDLETRVMEHIRQKGTMLAGVHESLRFFRSRGTRIALASSSSFEIIDTVLAAMDLTGEFELTHSAENEVHGKPSPDVYLSTLRLLGVDAVNVVAIEDSRNGITAAQAAGIRCIGIPDTHAEDLTQFAHADVVLGSLNDINEKVLSELGFQATDRP
jgi:HAD superfamily hydrolase (TIGR01509 family)